MSRVLALVEGSTEKKFVMEVLGPYLSFKGVYLSATLLGRGRKMGGVGPYIRFRGDMLKAIKQGSANYFTTMFDYYALPDDWPGRRQAKKEDFKSAAGTIERAILEDISMELGDSFNNELLLPYIQMHEFEALLFSNPVDLAASSARSDQANQLASIVEDAGEPEAIDDSPETAPSKRIKKVAPGYQKTVNGIIAAKKIGIAEMRKKCGHFRQWLEKLESLGN